MSRSRSETRRRMCHVCLVRPTHYDDDGYPISWWRGIIPSNSLAVLHSLTLDAVARRVLGEDVDVAVHVFDEATALVRPRSVMRRLGRDGARVIVLLVGVQTNQFPRASDLARGFLSLGAAVVVGGFHVSGYRATMGEIPPEAEALRAKGVSFFLGEAEGRIDAVLVDAFAGVRGRVYDYLGDYAQLSDAPPPVLPDTVLRTIQGRYASIDLGRGCPFSCTFCTVINVLGHKSRFRSEAALEQAIRTYAAKGIHRFFFTDDNVARNRHWRSLFAVLERLRKKERIPLRILAQVDVESYKVEGFIDAAVAAGVDQIFIGLESVNPENLAAVGKRQNKVHLYQEALWAWKRHPVVVTAATIVGLPGDTPESVRRDVEIIQRTLPVDIVYFTYCTPLPGSVDHREALRSNVPLDADLNKYDTHHPVMPHPKMSPSQWEQANRIAWRTFYTEEHMRTVLRRMIALGSNKRGTTINRLALYSYFGCRTSIHPIDGGLLRRMRRTDRRPGLPQEHPLRFAWRLAGWWWHAGVGLWLHHRRLWRMYRELVADPDTASYSDEAIAGVAKNRS